MGYGMPIVCKELYLPVSGNYNGESLQNYKEITGVDLSKYIVLSGSHIYFDIPNNVKPYIVAVDGEKFSNQSQTINTKILPLIMNFPSQGHSASTDALTRIGYFEHDEGCFFGIDLKCEKTDEFTLENIYVEAYLIY